MRHPTEGSQAGQGQRGPAHLTLSCRQVGEPDQVQLRPPRLAGLPRWSTDSSTRYMAIVLHFAGGVSPSNYLQIQHVTPKYDRITPPTSTFSIAPHCPLEKVPSPSPAWEGPPHLYFTFCSGPSTWKFLPHISGVFLASTLSLSLVS